MYHLFASHELLALQLLTNHNIFFLYVTYYQLKYFEDQNQNLSYNLFNNYLKKNYTFFLNQNIADTLRNMRNEVGSSVLYYRSLIGLISEGLSKLGADVTGIDFIEENIKVAKMHSKKNKLKINFKVKDFEKEKITSKFDVIIIFEVLEHLNDWQKFLKKLRLNLKKNGVLIISTINKNLISKFLTIDIAENLLKWIPANTHNYYKFITPNELEFFLSSNNFSNIKFKGLTYDPLKLKWKLSENTKINFFCSCNLN